MRSSLSLVNLGFGCFHETHHSINRMGGDSKADVQGAHNNHINPLNYTRNAAELTTTQPFSARKDDHSLNRRRSPCYHLRQSMVLQSFGKGSMRRRYKNQSKRKSSKPYDLRKPFPWRFSASGMPAFIRQRKTCLAFSAKAPETRRQHPSALKIHEFIETKKLDMVARTDIKSALGLTLP